MNGGAGRMSVDEFDTTYLRPVDIELECSSNVLKTS